MEMFAFAAGPVAFVLTFWTVQLLRMTTVATVKLSANQICAPRALNWIHQWANPVC